MSARGTDASVDLNIFSFSRKKQGEKITLMMRKFTWALFAYSMRIVAWQILLHNTQRAYLQIPDPSRELPINTPEETTVLVQEKKKMKGIEEDRKDEKKAVAGAGAPAKHPPFFLRKWTTLDKRSFSGVLFTHSLCLLAPFQFNWAAFWLAIVLYNIIGLFGMTLSYHRNLAHKSFKLPKWLEYTFAYIGVQLCEGDPIDWVSTHRHHHQYTDVERDPHSPIQGFWFCHMGWVFSSYHLTEKVSPKYVRNFEENEANDKDSNHVLGGCLKHGRPSNVEDLQSQAYYRFLRKTYVLHIFGFGALLYAMGGLPFVVWGMGVRSMLIQQATYAINSIAHTWGSQPWNSGDRSRNNWLMGLLAFGEGWHNNHHAFEYSARHGLEWWQLDVTWWVILFLEAVGLATDVKYPTELHKQKLAKQPTEPNKLRSD